MSEFQACASGGGRIDYGILSRHHEFWASDNTDDMSEDDLEYVKAAVAEYKRIRPIVAFGDLYRLISPYESDFAALMYVSEDKSRALVFAYNVNHYLGHPLPRIQLRGLDPDRTYSIKEINVRNGHVHSTLDGHVVGGDTLTSHGMTIHLTKEHDSAVFELV